MIEQEVTTTKLSKSQKKKKAAQRKKLEKRKDREKEYIDAEEEAGRLRDEIDARTVELSHGVAMRSKDFQMRDIRGKLLAHPSERFFEAFTNLRMSMGRESYSYRVTHARKLFHFGLDNVPLHTWSLAMGTASFIPINRTNLDSREESLDVTSHKTTDGEGRLAMFKFADPVKYGRKGAFTDQTELGLIIWYPIIATCMAAGDKLACIALRDTCVTLRICYGLFRKDTTRIEQLAFDPNNPDNVKQLEWVARRVEILPSPPQTPPRGSDNHEISSYSEERDPFRAPMVFTKRWSDYDDDDESLGSPMALPVTPESTSDIPTLTLGDSSGIPTEKVKDMPRRAPTVIVATPTLANSFRWFCMKKTLLPIPRISIIVPEDYPRSNHTNSLHPMKLQSSTSKLMPALPGIPRERGRLEHWVRQDVETKLKARLMLSSAERKKLETESEPIIYNRLSSLPALNPGESIYFGEPDILGAGAGICMEDIGEVVIGRFRDNETTGRSKVVLVYSPEGWICKQIGEMKA